MERDLRKLFLITVFLFFVVSCSNISSKNGSDNFIADNDFSEQNDNAITDDATDDVTNETIDEAVDEVTDEATHEATDDTTDETTDEIVDETTDEDVSNFPDLNGSWVNLTFFKGVAKPFLIATCNAWAIMISKVTIKQNGDILESQSEMCRLKVGNDTVPHIESLILDSYARSLPMVSKTSYLSKNESGEIFFHQPKIWEVRSCTLEDPENDKLPTKVDDIRVFDPDNTGINGLKIQAKGTVNGFAEIVQKVSTILNGKLNSNGDIKGIATWSEDQKVLWTDNILMREGSPTSPNPNGDPADSYFIFKRIDPAFDCQWIYDNSAALFPEAAELYQKQFEVEGG